MLYILPPPRAPNPPSPWESILCNNSNATERKSWDTRKPPPRVRLKGFSFRNDDGSVPQDDSRSPKSLNECYFAGKGTALVLPAAEAQKSNRQNDAQGSSNIRKHLQSIVDLLRPEETLKMAVKLESGHPSRIRYLVIVSRMGTRGEESCLLGIDCNDRTTVGLVLKVMADTTIRLDGDGGFSVSVCGRHHIFKPVSVQAMWSALQTLHKVSSKARDQNYFQGGLTHSWVNYYEDRIESDRSCLNEWHAMDNLESKRPPSPDSIRTKPRQREETEKVIRTTLKEIMMSVDLDEVTSKYIRTRLEEELDMDLGEYKSFIDQEMLTILGQMDAPTEIFDHVYLGSEWNASNYEELQRNGVGHILNVTREIDNFFPGTFDYLNVRVLDDEKTDLLKHWDDTFKYINKAKMSGSKVLVHCKMGVSRSASVVIAYAMKACNWDFETAMHHVKEKRTCIKPNTSFLTQLETYQGILDAMKNKEKLQRSKSETNLKAKTEKVPPGGEPTPVVQALCKCDNLQTTLSGLDLRDVGERPKSWSPDNAAQRALREAETSPAFRSLEDLSQKSTSKESVKNMERRQSQARHVLDNGETYSVSPNKFVHLSASVKDRINELESQQSLVRPKTEIWDPGDEKSPPPAISTNFCDSRTSVVVVEEQQTVWTSSTVVKSDSINQVVPESRDPFSNQLDRVFDREEKKQQRISSIPAIPTENNNNELRECPSRQSSWSSYDSAVQSGLSRHSSWGSGDTRVLPSRNSSWGSYDMRPRGPVHYINEKGEKILHPSNPELFESGSSGIFPYDKEDIPWHPGTVKRTKQKIEESSKNDKSSSETLFDEKPAEAINEQLLSAISIKVAPEEDFTSRLSVSAPETSSMELVNKECLSRSASNVSQISKCKEHRTFLENFKNEDREDKKNDHTAGIVRNLKKEFEAKSTVEQDVDKKNIVNSLPSSPVSVHQEKAEDLNFKDLVGLFENKQDRPVTKRVRSNSNKSHRYSCIENSTTEKTYISTAARNGSDVKRPPIFPVVRNAPPNLVVAATVIAQAAKKQQQYGRSHPLARLTIKPRHNNPVYNTM